MAPNELKIFTFGLFLTQAALSMSPAFADDLPFSVQRMSICDFAVDGSQTHRSLRSLYSCNDKVIIITNVSTKTSVFDDIVLNEDQCKNHLFLDGDSEGPIQPEARRVVATTCSVSRVDLKVDGKRYSYRF